MINVLFKHSPTPFQYHEDTVQNIIDSIHVHTTSTSQKLLYKAMYLVLRGANNAEPIAKVPGFQLSGRDPGSRCKIPVNPALYFTTGAPGF